MLDVLLEQVPLVDIQILKEERLPYHVHLLLTQRVGRHRQAEAQVITNNLVATIVALPEDPHIQIILHHLLQEAHMALQVAEAQVLVLCPDLRVEVVEVPHQEEVDVDNLIKKQISP